MSQNFLIISNPQLYRDRFGDVPIFYDHLAKDKRINLSHCNTERVINSNSELIVRATQIEHSLPYEKFIDLNNLTTNAYNLEQFDLAFCRSLKPFPSGYLDRLSEWEQQLLFVNSPSNKREQITANFLLRVAKDWIPDTVVTNDYDIAFTFWLQHQTIIAKQTNSCGGRGVYKIWYEASLFQVDNFNHGLRTFKHFAEVLDYLTNKTNAPLQFVRYLPQVNKGDKRIVVVDGEIYGAYIRRSKSGHWVNNVSGDGECALAEITDAEKQAIANTVGVYQQMGLHTLGYDFLLDDGIWRISEINAGNIGGFARLEQLTQTPVMARFINWLINFSQNKKVARLNRYPVINSFKEYMK